MELLENLKDLNGFLGPRFKDFINEKDYLNRSKFCNRVRANGCANCNFNAVCTSIDEKESIKLVDILKQEYPEYMV